ncbi:MAG: hypothetical protein IJ215_05265 [Clostridia bacterium]|nr:hypothetical protein [Clostridia bacterium]
MWKKLWFVFSVMFVCFIALTSSFGNSFAATKEDVLSALNQTYQVSGESFKLPQKYISKGEEYLNNNDLTSEQYDTIINAVGKAVAIAESAGTTDLSKISKEDKQKALGVVMETSRNINLDLETELSKSNNNASNPTNSSEDQNVKVDSTDNANSSTDISGEVTISGEGISGETENENESTNMSQSGESTNSSGSLMGLIESLRDEGGMSTEEIEQTVDKNITLAIVGMILILFINIFIIYLIFKSKWNKIIKYILMVIFILLLLVLLAALIYGLINLGEIRVMYKLYYMFI